MFEIIRVQEREERAEEAKNLFEEIIDENFPHLGKRHPRSGSTKSAKQDEPKEVHTKMHYN